MKMVSAAKLRRATDRIVQMRPYANKLNEMISNIASGVTMALAKDREVKKVLLVVVTSDRGLAGAFNSNIIKLAKQTIAEKFSAQAKAGKLTILPVGKKAFDSFRRLPYPVSTEYAQLFQTLDFEHSSRAAEWMLQQYSNEQFDVIEMEYSQFKNAATQVLQVERLLPFLK